MKLTFKTKGNIEIDYRVWLDNSDKEVEKATIMVIERHGDSVVDEYSVCETIMSNEREYLAAILGCRPDNVEVSGCNIKCKMDDLVFSLSGTFDFDIVSEIDEFEGDELPTTNVLCDNIKSLIYESIRIHGDFIDDSILHNKLNDKFWGVMDVDFYYNYKSTYCEANLER